MRVDLPGRPIQATGDMFLCLFTNDFTCRPMAYTTLRAIEEAADFTRVLKVAGEQKGGFYMLHGVRGHSHGKKTGHMECD